MSVRLLLRLPAVDTEPVSWLRLDEDRVLERGQCPADAPTLLTQVVQDAQVIVAVPATAVLLTAVKVNLRNRQKLRQALPYLLEDQLLKDVEAYHFAIGPQHDGQLSVAVITHERMRAWTSWLQAAQVQVAHMLPETLLLPHSGDQWTVLVQQELTLVRTDELNGFACDTANLQLVLARAAAAKPPAQIICYLAEDLDSATFAEHISSILPDTNITLFNTKDVDYLLAQSLTVLPSLNLLQQQYALGGSWQEQAQRWRLPAILAGSWLILMAGRQVYNQILLSHEASLLQTQTMQLYRDVFPQDKRIVDVRAQMQQHLRELRDRQGQEGFLKLLGEAAPVLAAMPGFQLRGLQYHDGVLDIDLQAANVQALDQAKAKLSTRPVALEVVSVESQGPIVNGRISIRSRA